MEDSNSNPVKRIYDNSKGIHLFCVTEIGCDLSKFANLGVHGESSKETSRSLSGDENAGLDVDEANLITDDDRVILV